MASSEQAMPSVQHPAPHRSRVGFPGAVFGLLAGPLAWSGHLLATYALASHHCYPGAVPRPGMPGGAGLWTALLVIDAVAAVLALLGAVTAFRGWMATRAEASHHPLEVGEGRTRFLAICGVIASLGFLAAIAVDVIALFMVPLCRG
jgi:hypothetical protein